MAVAMQLGRINERWPLMLPDFRVEFYARRPNWERGRLADCAEFMKPGMVVFDVGAEHGCMTTLYRQWVEPGGQVIPIEPAAHYWPFIRDTFEANGFGPPRACFPGFAADASDVSGKYGITRGWPAAVNVIGVPDGGFRHLAQDTYTPRVTLDYLVARTGVVPDAVVMDIEGAEQRAMVGARGLLEAKRTTFWVSVHEPTMLDWYGHTLDGLNEYITGFGYSATELPQHGEIETFWVYAPL